MLVTTGRKGVFFGYVPAETDLTRTTLRLEKAQNCLYWSAEVRGVFGLAVTGPTANCRVGPAVPALTVHEITSVSEATPEAARAWEAAPWK
ncbi:hypothetical protein DYH09_09895 [bacterium CPR1]|nr:hypothetical protein [bacterium CPR1]